MGNIRENINKTTLCNEGNYGGRRNTRAIKYIVIHYTGNDGDRAISNCKYFQSPNRGASAHYFIDEEMICQSVEDDCVAWSVGGRKYPNCLQTGGGKFYGRCNNNNSISIEMCDCVDGVAAKTKANVKELVAYLMATYNISPDNVIRHFDVVGKSCPLPLVDNDKWEDFKNTILGKEEIEFSSVAINLFGTMVNAQGINLKDYNYVKLRDLECGELKIGWDGKNVLVNDEVFEVPDNKKVYHKDTNYIHVGELRKLGFVVEWDSKHKCILIDR